MAETLLQTYLNNQFIKTTEEGNITNLKKATDELVKQLQKKKSKIIAHTLVAIDPQISESDLVVIEVEKIIIKKWPAFKNNVTATKDKATTYIRAVILEALTKLAKDAELGTLIWLSSKNLVQYYKLHKEEETIASLLQSFANQTEKEGQSSWGISNQIEIPTFSIPEISIESKIVSKDFLIKRLHAATGPTSIRDGVNETNEKANRYWPNSDQNWSGDFGDIAGEAISSSINNVLKGQNKSLSSIKDQINTSLEGLTPFFEQIGLAFLQSAEMSNKRSQLLWWKETLYSLCTGKSYRNMSPVTSAIAMALDLSTMVDPIYPESVDFLLKESMKSVYGDQVNSESTLADLVEQASKMDDQEKSLLKVLSNDQEGRKAFGTALANKLNNDNSNLFEEIGIEKDVKVTLADFSVWVFHDFQSQKIASKK